MGLEGRATRRRLMRQALGLVPLVRDGLDAGEADDRRPRDAGEPADGEGEGEGERGYRTYREGVAALRRRELADGGSPPASPAREPAAPRTWREGAAEVAARERRAIAVSPTSRDASAEKGERS